MDYLSYINGQFEIDTYNKCVAYFTNGETKVIDVATQLNFEELCYYVSNRVSQDQYYNIGQLVGFTYYVNEDTYFIGTNKQDFYMFGAIGFGEMDVQAVVAIDENGYYVDIDDYNGIENYAQFTSLNAFNYGNTQYGVFDQHIKANANNEVIFDYSSLHYDLGSWTTDVLNVRGENVSFHNVYFYITPVNAEDLHISYGSPYSDIAYDEFQRGQGIGYTTGWVNGQDAGYTAGLNAGLNYGGGTPQTATAFTYIEGAFNVAGSIMSLEILPNITLGLVWSIPLVFVLIMTIFKLVRK